MLDIDSRSKDDLNIITSRYLSGFHLECFHWGESSEASLVPSPSFLCAGRYASHGTFSYKKKEGQGMKQQLLSLVGFGASPGHMVHFTFIYSITISIRGGAQLFGGGGGS